MNKGTIDLSQGPIVKTLVKLAAPIMASSFLSAAYNITDMAWVGTLGAKSVAGVGVAGMYLWLFNSLAALPRIGGQVETAQSIGRKDMTDAQNYAKAALQLALIMGLAISALSLIFAREMVGFFNLQDSISESCGTSYVRITCGVIFFMFLNLTLTGLFTAQGDSKTPLIANFCGLALNMFLDPMLILGIGFFPRLETNGAALATATAQFVVLSVLSYRLIRTRTGIFNHISFADIAEKKYFSGVIRIGTPASIQSAMYCGITMIVSRMIAEYGPEAMAVVRVGSQIEALTWNTSDGFSSALNSFCGQNYGAGRPDRIRRGYNFSIFANFGWGTVVLLLFVFAPEFITSFFFHEDLAIKYSVIYLIIIGLSEPFMAVELVSSGALAGVGRTRTSSLITTVITLFRIPVAYLLKMTPLGLSGIFWAISSTTIAKGIVLTAVFHAWIRNNVSFNHDFIS